MESNERLLTKEELNKLPQDKFGMPNLLDVRKLQDAKTYKSLLASAVPEKLKEALREYLRLHMIEFDCNCEEHQAKLELSVKEIFALFKSTFGAQIDALKKQAKTLEKKLDDREADLINAKKEERERIIKEVIKHLKENGVGWVTGNKRWNKFIKKLQALKADKE